MKGVFETYGHGKRGQRGVAQRLEAMNTKHSLFELFFADVSV